MVQHMHVLSVACSALRELFSASGLIDSNRSGVGTAHCELQPC
jgi:hypothetical protein